MLVLFLANTSTQRIVKWQVMQSANEAARARPKSSVSHPPYPLLPYHCRLPSFSSSSHRCWHPSTIHRTRQTLLQWLSTRARRRVSTLTPPTRPSPWRVIYTTAHLYHRQPWSCITVCLNFPCGLMMLIVLRVSRSFRLRVNHPSPVVHQRSDAQFDCSRDGALPLWSCSAPRVGGGQASEWMWYVMSIISQTSFLIFVQF